MLNELQNIFSNFHLFFVSDIPPWLEICWREIPSCKPEPPRRPQPPWTAAAGASSCTTLLPTLRRTSSGSSLAPSAPFRTSRSSATCRRTSARDSASSPWPTTTSAWSPSSPSTATPSATGSYRSASRPTNTKCKTERKREKKWTDGLGLCWLTQKKRNFFLSESLICSAFLENIFAASFIHCQHLYNY